ncbi:aminotransferase-like domain-containing protein [Snodgrassella alvi]|jgi:2-aminoadipate transaminase|uniref:aminotransferase-like domain-containing protein n=1 Tax=Snodgrassella alvi TaxID=1196083 RepID=UPI000C1E022E|nr:PLP-dependent aminotransferase family protein [Snodgrassella alvi]PIT24276.1 hypothetical protein BGI37_10150 [Snodgrassella alvi]PIT43289.1 hypothetical protein BHC51_11570 [Snodgrassella alvi]
MTEEKNYKFSEALSNSNPSFIREILKLTAVKDMISFAGGLPDANLFPKNHIKSATLDIFEEYGNTLFQYTTTEGLYSLRQWIADTFSLKHGCSVTPEQVLIVSGSQQALDLVGKIFINKNDNILIESPSYLGAIQAFNLYSPCFNEISMSFDGINLDELNYSIESKDPKFFYGIPNFQNPTGISYSIEKRKKLAELLIKHDQIMVEDDPYGELNYNEQPTRSVFSLAPDNVIYLGSFSKVFAPSFRLGWIISPEKIMEKLIVAKQASDLHTNYFSQVILNKYLNKFDITDHIINIRNSYAEKRKIMIDSINEYMDKDVIVYPSNGGMFIWIKIPNTSSMDLLPYAIKNKVAFIPGETFSTKGEYKDQIRLNYTSLTNENIILGIKLLQKSLLEYRLHINK